MAPVFVENPSDVGPPPYSFFETTSVTFRLKADVTKLESLTNTLVNDQIDTNKHEFEPNRIAPQVYVTFSKFPKVESSEALLGSLAYQEVVFSFPIYDQKPPYDYHELCACLFLDGPESGMEEYFAWSPIATGRELYGLPKVRGEITFNPINLTGQCHGLLPGAGSKLEPQSIIRIELADSDPLSGVQGCIDNLLHRGRSDDLSDVRDALLAAEKRIRNVAEPRQPLTRRQQELLRFFWGDLDRFDTDRPDEFDFAELNGGHESGISLGLVGLRQLHDARTSNHDDAVHQQVISARFEFEKFHESAVQAFTVHVDNDQVRDRLGLDSTYAAVQGSDVKFVCDAGAVFAESGDVSIFE